MTAIQGVMTFHADPEWGDGNRWTFDFYKKTFYCVSYSDHVDFMVMNATSGTFEWDGHNLTLFNDDEQTSVHGPTGSEKGPTNNHRASETTTMKIGEKSVIIGRKEYYRLSETPMEDDDETPIEDD